VGKEMRRDRKYMQKKEMKKNGRRIGNEGKNSNKSLFFFPKKFDSFLPFSLASSTMANMKIHTQKKKRRKKM
jgi:hypothetical protein